MKNLKKAFSLVLAAAMMCSLLVINAGATDYSDDASITHTEAVSVMSQLNIIGGYTDGSFQPTKVVTRAEMCKMLCVALNGGSDPILGSDSGSLFSDTNGHWAEAYIAYCYNLGLVSGDSGTGGTFRPDATVTGAEAAKMMLVAIGYNSEFAGFTGSDWSLNVTVLANQKGLFDEISSLTLSSGLTRDDAAQLIYNGINANMVEYDNVLSTNSSGLLTSTAKVSEIDPAETIISDSYGATKLTGYVLANENGAFSGAPMDEGYTWIDLYDTDTEANGDKSSSTEIFEITTSADLLGQAVTFYVKETSSSSKNWTVCGAPIASDDNTVVTFTSSKASSLTQAKFDDAMEDAGITDYDATVIENYAATNDMTFAADDEVTTNAEAYALRADANGITVSFIDNDGDEEADFISVFKPAVGKVATYSTTGDGYITVTKLSGANSEVDPISGEEFENVIGVEDVAKGDIVTYYKIGSYWYITNCSTVTAAVTSYSSPNVTASGTTYKPANLAEKFNDDGATTLVAAIKNGIGDDVTFYLDSNGFVVYVGEVTASTDFCVVLSSNDDDYDEMDTLRAKVVFDDGTLSTITVSEIGGDDVDSEGDGSQLDEMDVSDGTIYNYTKLSDGTYNLVAEDADDIEYPTAVTKSSATLTGVDALANSNTVFVMGNYAKTSFSANTGVSTVGSTSALNVAAAGTTLDSAAISLMDSDGYAVIVFAYGGVGSTSNAKYIYVLSTSVSVSQDDDGDEVYTYKTIVNGEYTDLVVVGDDADDAFSKKGMYRVDNDGDALVLTSAGKLEVDDKLTSGVTATDAILCSSSVIKGSVVDPTDGELDTIALTYDDDTLFLVVDGTTVTETTVDEIAIVSDDSEDTSDILITRGSADTDDDEYTVAGVVYICK